MKKYLSLLSIIFICSCSNDISEETNDTADVDWTNTNQCELEIDHGFINSIIKKM